MKLLGLLGGTSWPSTPLYYRQLNEAVAARLGGFHSANLLLRSIDYNNIKTAYQNDWPRVRILLKEQLDALVALGPTGIILCNNTLHKALDELDYEKSCPVPFFHAAKETGKALQKKGITKTLLLATRFTMEDGFFARCLKTYGVQSLVPDEGERVAIQNLQTALASGMAREEHTRTLSTIVARYKPESVVLACTELPLALQQNHINVPLLDSISCQCVAAIDYALES